jgi:endoplasmic reticulum resident protein 44
MLLFACSVPGKLKQFVQDLHSGKLHREFHYGPDQPHAHHHQHGGQHGGHQEQKRNEQQQQPQQPPESTFRKLQPGKSRYTFIDHDEL